MLRNRSSRADTKETNEALAESWQTSTVRKAPEYTAWGRHGNSTVVEVSNISWTLTQRVWTESPKLALSGMGVEQGMIPVCCSPWQAFPYLSLKNMLNVSICYRYLSVPLTPSAVLQSWFSGKTTLRKEQQYKYLSLRLLFLKNCLLYFS